MKRIKGFALAALAALLLAAPASYAADNMDDHMMDMSMGQDSRTELDLPEQMKVKQKAMMRKHLDTISAITAALAANDLSKAGTVARENLGWSFEEEQRCEQVSIMTGEEDFVTLGKAVHQKADDLADAAMAGDRDQALVHLSQMISNCNACHKRFRH